MDGKVFSGGLFSAIPGLKDNSSSAFLQIPHSATELTCLLPLYRVTVSPGPGGAHGDDLQLHQPCACLLARQAPEIISLRSCETATIQ